MVGLSHDAMATWCNVSVQPVIDAYNKLIYLNMSVSMHVIIKQIFGEKKSVASRSSSDKIQMFFSKLDRLCHLGALLIHKESHILNSVLSYMFSAQQMGVGPTTVNATAARIVKIVQSFYQASINRTRVTKNLIMTFSNQFSLLMGQPLNPEAQHHWYSGFQSLYLESR